MDYVDTWTSGYLGQIGVNSSRNLVENASDFLGNFD